MLHSVLLSVIMFSIGCSGTLKFRVVDAQTGMPLEGVTVRHSRAPISYFSKGPRANAVLGPTANDGILEASDLESSFAHYFTFSKEGYRNGERGCW